MGLMVTLAGQDISDFVDEDSIDITSILGQGAGSGAEGTGQTTTAEFVADIGPISTALGAGQSRPATYVEIVKSDAPLAYFRMDQENACPDVSGHANNGTIVNGPLLLAPGSTGDLNPSWGPDGSAYVQLPLFSSATNGVGVSFMVLLENNQAMGPIFSMGDWATGQAIGIGATDWQTGGVNLLARGGASYKPAGSAIPLPVGQWVHVAITWSNTLVSYYVNSVLQGTSANGGNLPTGHAYIGFASNGMHAVNMQIDEIAWWGSILAPTRWSAHYGARSVGPALVRQGEVVVTDATGTAIFGGYATNFADASLPLTLKTKITCHDYMQDLDRVIVNEVYTGQTDVYIIRDIITKYAPWIDLSGVPATGSYTFPSRYVRAKSVYAALNGIASVTGFLVWVSPDKVLHYASATSASTAPFNLSDQPDFIGLFTYDFLKYEVDDNGIINRVYFYGGKQVSADFTQDLSPQANGTNKVFALAYFPHAPSTGAIVIKVAGVTQTFGTPFDTSSSGKLISQGGTSQVLLDHDAKTLTFDTAPTAANLPTILYRYETPLVIVISDKSSENFYGSYYDGKLDDQSVLDYDTAVQRARVLLAQQSFGLVSLQIVTWTAGLQAGQLLSITNGLRGLNAVSYLVQKVETKPLGGGAFEYTVDLGAWNWNLIDLIVSTARRAGVQDTTTGEDTSIVQAQETLEAGTVVLVKNLTTHTSGVYYSRTTPSGDGHDAYSGYFTITS